jgi:TatD DNase family protein
MPPDTLDLVDSHCHLDFPELAADLPAVIARAHAAGVRRMVTICTRLRTSPRSAPSPRRIRPSSTPPAPIR